MSTNDNFTSGFNELSSELSEILRNVSNVQDILVVGAEEMVEDLSKLPKPYSQLKRVKSKHMLDVMGYRRAKNNEVEVGSGAYWLRYVELGTRVTQKRKWKTPANPFMRRTWDKNKTKYQKKMLKKAGLEP